MKFVFNMILINRKLYSSRFSAVPIMPYKCNFNLHHTITLLSQAIGLIRYCSNALWLFTTRCSINQLEHRISAMRKINSEPVADILTTHWVHFIILCRICTQVIRAITYCSNAFWKRSQPVFASKGYNPYGLWYSTSTLGIMLNTVYHIINIQTTFWLLLHS